jgi:exopolyphosphatase/pppGpp-phosphohydrolase
MTFRGNPWLGLPGSLALALVTGAACRAAPDRLCAIDMGSNSFRRIVGTFADGNYTELGIDSKTMGVGDDVEQHGGISQGKLREIGNTLSEFRVACEADGAPSPVAVGTAAFRDAPNGDDAIAVARQSGIRMEIASEERESELAYLVGSLGREGYAVIDNGSRSIELVAKPGGVLQHRVFNLGYRVAYQEFFAAATDPAQAIRAFRERLRTETSAAAFMKGHSTLAGVEFMEMAETLFSEVPDGHAFTLAQLKARLDAIAGSPSEFARLKAIDDIDRALPRLVVAVDMMEAFGYSEMSVTSRQLGAGLIIEAGLRGR